jgi:hypothetical protein
MIIYINDQEFPISYYDDKVFVLKRYSLKKGFTLPKYLRISNKDVSITEGVSLKIIDVRDEFKWLELENLSDEELIIEITDFYPYLVKKDLAVIIFYNKYRNVDWSKKITSNEIINDISILKKIDGFVFFNNIETISIMEFYPTAIKKRLNIIQSEINIRDEIDLTFNQVKPIPLENFLIEELSIRYVLDNKTEFDLIDVFDGIDVSRTIPFIYYKPENLTGEENPDFFKLYDLDKNLISWVEDANAYLPGRLYFKILSSNFSMKKNINDNYYTGEWFDNNDIEVSFKIETNKESEEIKKTIFNAIGDRLEYKLLSESQIGVKGIYSVANFSFNKAVLADMVSNFHAFSYFLFFNENPADNKSKFKTATSKERFMFHYEPNQKGPSNNALSITITPQFIELENKYWIDVRIRKATNITQIESFKFVFSILLYIYNSNCKSVIKEYTNLLPSSKLLFDDFLIKSKTTFKQDDKKSGKRLVDLKNTRPGVFRPGYASMCQPKKTQPYILNPEKVEKYRDEYGDHKLMEFEDPSTKKKDWYACEPRDKGEPPVYIYPGLRKNNVKSSNYNSEVPFVPCCFSEDQYTKTGAELYKRITASKKSSSSTNDTIGEIGHILATNKDVPPGRYGKIPYYLSFIARKSGYENFDKGKQTTIPIFRYGVEISPDSFLHCMEKAFNHNYSTSDLNKKKKLVKNIRIEMSNMNFAPGRQELYNYPDDVIRDMLLDENQYIDPKLWVSLVAAKYNCNIFIYKISDKNPNGSIVIPNFSQTYLTKYIISTKPTVFIIKKMQDDSVSYQTEILLKYNHKAKGNKRFKFVFQNDILITQAIKMFYESISVSIISPEYYHTYKPINENAKLFDGSITQYIDINGKSRMLSYNNNICLMTPPLPPFNKEENIEMIVTYSTLTDALDFIKLKDLTIFRKYSNRLSKKIEGLWVKSKKSNIDGLMYGYIPIISDNDKEGKLKNIEYSNIYLYNLLEVDESSSLNEYRLLRKIAFFLKEYVLYHYAINSKILDSNDFIIKPNHIYDIYSLNKKLLINNPAIYQNGKIIVTTEKTRENLINFLKVSLSTNYERVISYKSRTIVKNYYTRLNDFRVKRNQIIFNSKREVLFYLLLKKSNHSINTIKNNIEYDDVLPENPYYYRNYNINNGKLAIAQTLSDPYENTTFIDPINLLYVSDTWYLNRINVGHIYNLGLDDKKIIDKEHIRYVIYNEDGTSKVFTPENYYNSDETYSLLKSSKYSNTYSALLFL